MSKITNIARQVKSDTSIIDARGETDTIRLWENHRDQAILWRGVALMQIPTTVLALFLAVSLFFGQKVVLNVPAKPLPGYYEAQEIPDTEFIEYAQDYVNLIASYQPAVARRQFQRARSLVLEPMLARYDEEMLGHELKAIEQTNRTQVFFVDPNTVEIDRPNNKEVLVQFVGDRLKMVAGQELPLERTRYRVTLTTIPRNSLNPYGIMITNVSTENLGKDKDQRIKLKQQY